MKKLFSTKKRIAIVAAVAVVALTGVAAFAYFTSTGNGTGSATVGSATSWTVGETGTPTGGPLYPDPSIGGANIQTDGWTVTNGGSGSQYLTSVVIKIATSPGGGVWTARADPLKPACNASDFSVGGSAVGADHTDIAFQGTFIAGETHSSTVTVELIDNGANQDNCQGVTVPLYFYAS